MKIPLIWSFARSKAQSLFICLSHAANPFPCTSYACSISILSLAGGSAIDCLTSNFADKVKIRAIVRKPGAGDIFDGLGIDVCRIIHVSMLKSTVWIYYTYLWMYGVAAGTHTCLCRL